MTLRVYDFHVMTQQECTSVQRALLYEFELPLWEAFLVEGVVFPITHRLGARGILFHKLEDRAVRDLAEELGLDGEWHEE